MLKEELIKRSPLRIFKESIRGGLEGGELGLVASLSGIGKTSVLVQIGLDKLLRGQKIIHVSFTRHNDYVLAWYEDIFDEFIKKKNLENEQYVKNEILRNRVLMRFTQEGLSTEQILRSLKAMIRDGNFNAETVIIDGYDFSAKGREHIELVKAFAVEMGLSFWYSCNVDGEKQNYNSSNIPILIEDYVNLFDVVVVLVPKTNHVNLAISKDRETLNPEHKGLKLDPRTLLILEN